MADSPLRRAAGPVKGALRGPYRLVADRIDRRLQVMEQNIIVSQDSLLEQLAVQAATLRKVQAGMDRLAAEMASKPFDDLTGGPIDDFSDSAARFLNWSYSHNGPLARAGLWTNPPIVPEWRRGEVVLSAVNERIIEQPFVFTALADVKPGARVLDIGGGESTVAFSLASLGFDVTVIEPQGYPFQHPNLTVFESPLEEFTTDEPFDAVVLLSAIEHFGIGAYVNGPEPSEDADVRAMATVAGLISPEGRLVLTTPYGPPTVNELERIYDRAGIDRLLDGWEIRHAAVARMSDRRTWEMEAFELIDPPGEGRVVMLVATRAPVA